MQEEGEETIRVLTVRGKEYRLPAEHATTVLLTLRSSLSSKST